MCTLSYFKKDWALGVLHTKIICAMAMIGPNWWLKSAMEQVVQRVAFCALVAGICFSAA